MCICVYVCVARRHLCGFLCMHRMAGVGGAVQDFGSGWSSAKGWMEEFFRSILLKIPIFPQGTKCALVFGFLASGRKQVRGKNGIVDQLDFTLLLLLSQVWPTQQL